MIQVRIDSRHNDPGWSMVERDSWREDALCAEVDMAVFFPEKGGSNREAKGICGRCDVRAECLASALEADDRNGIYGGLSAIERRKLKGWQLGDPLPPVVVRRGPAKAAA